MTEVMERPGQQGGSRVENVPMIRPPRLPYHPEVEKRYGIDKSSWKALVEAIFPTASSPESVILALSYCRARKLDPFKRNVHIVPIWNKELRRLVDTIWPGIGELRTTAFRTGEYAGRDATEFGPEITQTFVGSVGSESRERRVEETVTFPEWAQTVVYRFVRGQRVAFAGPRVYWLETYSTQGKSDVPNDMWCSRPKGQLDKCSEAAALRAAFPEEIGSDYIADEVQHATGQAPPRVEQVAQAGVAGFAKRLANKPLSAGQVLTDPETDEVIQHGDDDHAAQDLEQHPFEQPGAVTVNDSADQPDPDVSGAEAEPPSNAFSPNEVWWAQVRELAQAADVNEMTLVNGIKKWALKEGVVKREHEAKPESQKALFDAIRERSGFFAK